MKWLLIVCYLCYVSSSLYFLIYSYFYIYFVILSFFSDYEFVLLNKEASHAPKANFILLFFFY